MLTMLPVLLLRGNQNVIDHAAVEQDERRAQIEKFWLSRPAGVTVVTLALCGLALTQFHKVSFDYNLLDMQSAGLPAVAWEKKLISSAQKSVLFAAVEADTPQEAVQLEAKIRALPVVAEVESISRFLTEDQRRQLESIAQIKQELAGVSFAEIDPGPVNVPELSRTLWSLQGYLGLAAEGVGDSDAALRQQLLAFRDDVVDLRKQMLAGPSDVVSDKLAEFQRALLEDMQETFSSIRHQDDRQALRVEDLPAVLRNRFVGVTGKYLLQVYPKKDVWQRANQVEFVGELRHALDPNGTNHPVITGTPVQLLEYTTLLKESYQTAAWYSLVAIMLLVFIHFRNVSSVVLALIPVAVGGVWLGGIMGFFHIPFNSANIMTLPLVIGIGVTNGIHILNRFAEERTPNIFAKSTGKAVLVSGLTTIAGFGSLMLAKHQGIRSLGCVMATGVAMCMIAGLTFLPALLMLWKGRGKKGRPSVNNARSTTGSGGTEVEPQT
jgi:predicted RND superfamily exporter protein